GDLGPLSLLSHLRNLFLNLHGCPSLEFLTEIPKLTRLYLNHLESVPTLVPISYLEELDTLQLHNCPLDPTAAITRIPHLERLYLHRVELHNDLTSLAGVLPQIKVLSVTDQNIARPELLGELHHAEFININRTGIVDLRPVSTLQRLKT